MRWDIKSNPVDYGVEQGEPLSKEAETLQTMSRQIYDQEKRVINFSNSIFIPKITFVALIQAYFFIFR